MPYTLEVCVDSLESALAAEEAGADRIELCSALAEGGLTPSHGLIQQVCRALTTTRVHVLIRPRGGDFLYSDQSEIIAIARADVLHAAAAGAAGIVAGFLTPTGTIDTDLTTDFVDLCAALNLNFTFHRAFDVVRDQQAALQALIGCRVPRVLTSGGHKTAYLGIEALSSLVAEGGSRIAVMAGGGITEDNAATICECTGVRDIHGTFRRSMETGMRFIHPRVTFAAGSSGGDGGGSEEGGGDLRAAWQRLVADGDVIARVKARLAALVAAEEERDMD
jgi:copper homeostasis protein